MTEQPHTATLNYRSPGDVRWVVRAEPARVTLVLDGPARWSRFIRPLSGLLVSGVLGLVFLVGGWTGAIRGRFSAGPLLFTIAWLVAIGWCAALCARDLYRCYRYGPPPREYHLTSRHLAAEHDPQTFFSDPPNVIRLVDVLPWSRGGQLILLLVPRLAPLEAIEWTGSGDDLERLVAELREALRLDTPAPMTGAFA